MERISEARERLLVQRYQDGDTRALEELMEAYKPVIMSQAHKVEPYYPLDDARQEAYLAFTLMVANHDPEKGRLYQRVKASLANALREASSLKNSQINIPSRMQRRFRSILAKADGDPVLGAEIAAQNQMPKATFLNIYHCLYGYVGETEEEGTSFYSDVLVDAETHELVEKALSVLDNEEIIVVKAAYAFTTYSPMTDAEIADGLLSKSQSTVRRIRTRALMKMRKAVSAV